jgi:hypothetical protein
MKKFFNFIYALFFTRDDDLDMLQVLFAVIIMQTLFIVTKLTLQHPEMSEIVRVESLVTLRWLTGLLVITAVPKWLVPFISNHTNSVNGALKKGTQDSVDSYSSNQISTDVPEEPTEETS